ncbi:MAG: hypothetical protein ACLFTK_12465 [Anaerolineales bacterium]
MWIEFSTRAWESLPTGALLRRLQLSRYIFQRHPLYRRWLQDAYNTRAAYLASEIPDRMAEAIPLVVLVVPLVAFSFGIIFGLSTFLVAVGITAFIFLVAALLVAYLGPIMTTGLAAGALATERTTGRWDVLMMIPYERAGVMMMRVASRLEPYRPIMATLEILQSLAGMLIALVLSTRPSAINTNLLGICFITAPLVIVILMWERRQDYALSIALGVYGGLKLSAQDPFRLALGSGAALVTGRAIIGLLAVGLAVNAHGVWLVLPVMIGGPGLLLMLGTPWYTALGLLALYYGGREWAIRRAWACIQADLHG